MDEQLKQAIVDFFTPSELVDFLLEDDDSDAMRSLVEHLWDTIEDNLDDVLEEINYGNK